MAKVASGSRLLVRQAQAAVLAQATVASGLVDRLAVAMAVAKEVVSKAGSHLAAMEEATQAAMEEATQVASQTVSSTVRRAEPTRTTEASTGSTAQAAA